MNSAAEAAAALQQAERALRAAYAAWVAADEARDPQAYSLLERATACRQTVECAATRLRISVERELRAANPRYTWEDRAAALVAAKAAAALS